MALPVSVCHQVSASGCPQSGQQGEWQLGVHEVNQHSSRTLWDKGVVQHTSDQQCLPYLQSDTGPRPPPGQTTSKLHRLHEHENMWWTRCTSVQ